MQTFEYWYDQDMTKPIGTRYTDALAFSSDALNPTVGVRLTNAGEAVTVTGDVACTVIRQDGGTVTFTGAKSGNAVSAALPGACFAVPGQIAVMLQIVDGDTKVTVLRAVYNVTASTTATPIDPGSAVPDLAELLAKIEDCEDATAAAVAATADAEGAVATVRAICPAVTVGPSAIVTVTDAVPLTLDALSVGISDANGVSSVTVTRTGKNLLLPSASAGSASNIQLTRNADYSVSCVGYANGTTRTPTIVQFALKAGTYVLSGVTGGSENSYGIRLAKVVSGSATTITTIYSGEESFTLDDDYTVRVSARFSNAYTDQYNVTLYPMIRPAAVTDSTYEPYQAETATIALGRTVTEGTLDVISGKLTVSGTDYEVTPAQIDMLDGANAIWADAGSVTLTYRANPYTRLLARIAALEAVSLGLPDEDAGWQRPIAMVNSGGTSVAWVDASADAPTRPDLNA